MAFASHGICGLRGGWWGWGGRCGVLPVPVRPSRSLKRPELRQCHARTVTAVSQLLLPNVPGACPTACSCVPIGISHPQRLSSCKFVTLCNLARKIGNYYLVTHCIG